jgi:hypothetical protein
MTTTLKESMQNMRGKKYVNVKRNDKAYNTALLTTTEELERLIDLYKTTVVEDDIRARLLRDSIDHWIRRYHKYAIQGKIKSHYHQRGVSLAAKDCIFEHVIPASTVRDKLIAGELTINQALNVPTCRVSRNVDTLLRKKGLHDSTPDGWFFFKRYQIALSDIDIETYNGQVINDLDTWTLQDHFDFFKIV